MTSSTPSARRRATETRRRSRIAPAARGLPVPLVPLVLLVPLVPPVPLSFPASPDGGPSFRAAWRADGPIGRRAAEPAARSGARSSGRPEPAQAGATPRAGRVETLSAVGALPAHVAGAFREAVDFEQAADGRYYVFDRRGHTVHVVGPGDLARPVVRIGLEEGRILQPAAFDLDPDGTFVVADAPGGRERVQIFSAEGSRINGFLLPGRAAVRVRLGPLVLNGVGSIQYTGRSVLLNQPESGALVTEYSFAGTPLRSFGALRRTGHEADRDVHLALNVGLPLVNPRGGFYFVFLTGVPLVRAFDAQGALRFERHIEGRELDDLVAGLPSVWPRRRGEDGELPLVTPSLRTAAVDRDGNLWVALVPPYVYVYDAEGEKRRTLQLRAPTGVIAPTSLSFSPKTGRLLVTPGCYEFEVR